MEAIRFVLLARERLDDADLGDRLLKHADRLALRILGGARHVADAAAEILADETDRRRHDEGEQREAPVHHEDDRDAAHQRQDLTEDLDDRLRDDPVHERRVAGHVRHQIARLLLIEERERERLQVGHDRHPQVKDDLLTGPRHHKRAHAVQRGPHEKHNDQYDHE